MAANIGKLNGQLVLNGSQFMQTLSLASGASKKFGEEVEMSNRFISRSMLNADRFSDQLHQTLTKTASGGMASASGGARRLQYAMQSLAMGVEDASVSFGLNGWAGALRGAGNNISQFASLIHPLAGMAAGLGVALGSVLVNRLKDTGEETKKAKDYMTEFRDSIQEVEDKFRNSSEWSRTFMDIKTSGAAADELGKVKDNLSVIEPTLAASQEKLRAFQDESARLSKQFGVVNAGSKEQSQLDARMQAEQEMADSVVALENERFHLMNRRKQLQDEMLRLSRGENAAAEEADRRAREQAEFEARMARDEKVRDKLKNLKKQEASLKDQLELRHKLPVPDVGAALAGTKEAASAISKAARGNVDKKQERTNQLLERLVKIQEELKRLQGQPNAQVDIDVDEFDF